MGQKVRRKSTDETGRQTKNGKKVEKKKNHTKGGEVGRQAKL